MTYKGILSEPCEVNCGVPQGSILGSLPFLLFVNDMELNTNSCKLDMYVDDSTLHISGKIVTNIEQKLELQLTLPASKIGVKPTTWS